MIGLRARAPQDPKPLARRARIELLSWMIERIADHRNRGNGSLSRGAKGEERCCLHFYCESAAAGPSLQLWSRLPIGGICCPNLAAAHAPSGRNQFPFKMRNNRCGARDFWARRQVMVVGPLVTNRSPHYHEARERQIVRQAAGGRQSNDEPSPCRMELLGNQYRIGSADRSCDD